MFQTRLRVDKDKPKGWFKGNWRDKYCLFLGYSETWDTLLILRGTKVIYLDYVGTLRPSKSYGWGVGWVAHKILVTIFPFSFSFLGPFWGLGFGLRLGLGLVKNIGDVRPGLIDVDYQITVEEC